MKLALGLVSAAVLSAGVVSAAPAATAATPYPNSIATFCSASGNSHAVKVRVRADSNRNDPRGTATVRVLKKGNVVRRTSVPFSGGVYGSKGFKTLGKGYYTFTVKANPANDAYKNCSHSFNVRVR